MSSYFGNPLINQLGDHLYNPPQTKLLLFLVRWKIPLIWKLYRIMLCCDIFQNCHSGLTMPHPYGIIVHPNVVLGKNVVIMQHVTLGVKDIPLVVPIVEDDVYIGAGAKVLGGVRVGRGSIIGANAVVTKDVPPGSTVVGANKIVKIS